MVERPPFGTPLAKPMEIPVVVRLAKLLVTIIIYFRTLCRDLTFVIDWVISALWIIFAEKL